MPRLDQQSRRPVGFRYVDWSAARRRRILEGTCRTADRRTAELNGRKIQGRATA
jgi:hypothetical protein